MLLELRAMTKGLIVSLVALALCGTLVRAHHSIAGQYDMTQLVTVEGVIAEYHFVNPHPYAEVDAPDASGRTERWHLEFDNLRELVAAGMSPRTFNAGDRVVVKGGRGRHQRNSMYVRSLLRPADGFLYEQIGSSPRVRLPSR